MVGLSPTLRELPRTQRDDAAALHQLLFGDDQGRCEADDLSVRCFAERYVVVQDARLARWNVQKVLLRP